MTTRKLKKWTLEAARELFESKGCRLVSDTIIDSKKPVKYICSCGGDGSTAIGHFIKGTRCLNCRTERTKVTNLTKYGVESIALVKEFKDKAKVTNLIKYGVENPFQNELIKEKIKQNNLEKYGVEHNAQREDVKQTITESIMQKYGVKHAQQHKSVSEKTKQTNLQKYGTTCTVHSDTIKEKIKQDNLEKYGVEYSFQREDVKDKIKSTNLERYGFENAQHNASVRSKQIKSAFSMKTLTAPNGKIFNYQGYEKYIIEKLISNGISECNILTEEELIDHELMPEFWYEHNGKIHRYYPDMFIVTQNKFIEVKSTYTYELEPEVVIAKAKCVYDRGYNMEIYVLNMKKEIVNLIKF